jgi:hypothetical protein
MNEWSSMSYPSIRLRGVDILERKKIIIVASIRTPDRPARSLVAVSTPHGI